jgi:hypothetical protein
MTVEKCCGTCFYYNPILDGPSGYCTWNEHNIAPNCIFHRNFSVWVTEGTDCRTWFPNNAVKIPLDCGDG